MVSVPPQSKTTSGHWVEEAFLKALGCDNISLNRKMTLLTEVIGLLKNIIYKVYFLKTQKFTKTCRVEMNEINGAVFVNFWVK